MPNVAPVHPIVVHFVIALLAVGVLFRVLSLVARERARFLGPAAATLIIGGAIASIVAAKSGIDAHGKAEHVPGCAEPVLSHESWGLRTRNVFLAVAALEILALALAKRKKEAIPLMVSALTGIAGTVCLFQAGRGGGNIVYSYAAGVGVRSNNPRDVGRLLLAGFYHQAEVERAANKPAEAFAVTDEMGRRFPDDVEVQLAVAESMLVDLKDPASAMAKLGKIDTDGANAKLQARKDRLKKRIEEGAR